VHCNDASAALELTRDDAWPTAVRSVSLTHASLISLPKLPQQNLHSLSLSHNALTSLPDNAFESLNLKELNLGYNGLKELTLESITGNNDLKVLHLQHNSFEKLDWDVLNSLENLQELYLQDNYIKILEGRSNLLQLKVSVFHFLYLIYHLTARFK
jgi:Leucine-rich repeat (LRR) protein